MINRVIEFSANHRLAVFLCVAAAVIAGWWSLQRIPLDAIPDLSDTQVIIYSRWDRSPDIVEAQVTYPLVTSLLGTPKVKDVRGFSDFGYSYIYVIFEDGTDLYWARSRVLEYLSKALPRLPEGVRTELGPDATGVGWVFQYALVDTSGRHNLADLRSVQDWYLRYQLQSVPGVAEVAPLGGFVRQYQVSLDPRRLRAYNIPISKVVAAVRGSNSDVGGRLLEWSGREYMVRGRGYARSTKDLESVVLALSASGTPVTVGDVGAVVLGPELRRGASDLDGKGEVVSGIVVMRQGENALGVIKRVKAKLAELEPSLPPGVRVITTYDRSDLILASVRNLKSILIEEVVVVSLIILLLLWHIPSALIPVLTIPITIAVAFLPLRLTGMTADIMSLGGIALAVGAMVDAAIVVVEQTHKRLEEWQRGDRQESARRVIIRAIQEVSAPGFFALLIIAVSFLPVLTLEAQEGRLFRPLAYTKSLCMLVAAVLAITLDPALRLLFTRVDPFRLRPSWFARAVNAVLVGKIHAEERHPVSRLLIHLYTPVVAWSLRWKWAVILGAAGLIAVTVPIYQRLGSEFMPPLDEGAILFMPTTVPGISLTEAQRVLQMQDRLLSQIPEVERVMGKVGRAESATDPAPLSMMETVVQLRPRAQWRKVPTWYSSWPEWVKPFCRHFGSDRISTEELIHKMNDALAIPGVSNAWTMPIKGRIDMLTTGIRTPVGIKIHGADLEVIEKIGNQVASVLQPLPGTRNVFAERPGDGYFLDFDLKRDQLTHYGLTVDDAQTAVANAIGGENVTTIVDGRARYPVNVRYMRDFRNELDQLGQVLVTTGSGQHISLAEIADIRLTTGPSMIRDEGGLLSGYVYVDLADSDIGGYVQTAQRLVRERVSLPAGYSLSWSGQYESMQRVRDRLQLVLPLTLLLIFLLLYANTKSVARTLLVLLAVPFSAVGAIWLLYLLGYHLSIGVWVGLIALLGVDAETGMFMLLYLDLSFTERKRQGRMRNLADLHAAVMDGAVRRIRPKVMTVAAMFMGIVPILWSTGAGSDVMKRIAAPLAGGIFTSFVLELVVHPALYAAWQWHSQVKRGRTLKLVESVPAEF